MKNISRAVVTGGAGFIGSHIVNELINRGIETFVIDNLSTGSMENLKQHRRNDLLHVFLGDVNEIERFLSDIDGINVVFHSAAIISVLRSVKEPLVVHEANVTTTLKIMNFCVSKNIKRFVFASSGAVYGKKEFRVSEEMQCSPASPYGASKLSVEDYLKAYQQCYNLEPVILRYFNVFGPKQIFNDYSGVITIFINQLLDGESPTIFGDGEQTRDFVHVSDIVQANMLAVDNDECVGKTLNVATGKSITILELLSNLKEIIGVEKIEHNFRPAREGDIKTGKANINELTSLGYVPKTSRIEGLKELVEYIRSIRVEALQV
jgi:UDP-glucose 4-epimerase